AYCSGHADSRRSAPQGADGDRGPKPSGAARPSGRHHRQAKPDRARGGSPMTRALDVFWSIMEFAVPLALALAYEARARRLAGEGRPVPVWRQVMFGAGLVVVCASLLGPIDDQADKLLWVHMIQHLLLADVASLFIVLGFTGPLLQPLLSFRAG